MQSDMHVMSRQLHAVDMHNNTDTLVSSLTSHSLNVVERSELRQQSAAVAPEQAEKSMDPVLPSQHVQLKGLPAAIYPERDSHMLRCDNIDT